MATSKQKKRKQAVGEELDRIIENDVFEVGKIKYLPKGVKILISTWAMKIKSNGDFRARLNMRGYDQDDSDHYESVSIFIFVQKIVLITVLSVELDI